jgi:hypothetical protein
MVFILNKLYIKYNMPFIKKGILEHMHVSLYALSKIAWFIFHEQIGFVQISEELANFEGK